MSKSRISMTSLDASLYHADTENELARAFEEDAERAAVAADASGTDRGSDRAVFSTALRTLLVSTTCHKP